MDQKYYCSNHHDVNGNKYGVKCGTSLRFWKNNGWINFIDPHGCVQWRFRYWLGKRSLDNKRQIARRKGIASTLEGKLVKVIKDVIGRFDDYSLSPKIRKMLLHWGYELVENNLLRLIFLFI